VTGTPVLVLRALGLGDALTAVPALRGLRRTYSGRDLLLAGRPEVSGWLRDQGFADGVLPVDGLSAAPPGRLLGRHRAVNLHGRGPHSHRLLQAGRPEELVAFDCPTAGHAAPSRWRADEHEVRRWCRLLTEHGIPCDPADLRLDPPTGPVVPHGAIVIHPGAASRSRQWPPARWAAVAAVLATGSAAFGAADPSPIVLTGGAAERGLCHTVALAAGVACADLSGRLGLDDLAAVVAHARLLLSGDTGVAHLATAYGTPSVTLFGPTPPRHWGPLIDTERHIVVYAGAGTGDPHAAEPDPALLRITVADVVSAARRAVRPVEPARRGTSPR
jgi:ADP-heptose:LPS heptosyltransferase